MWLPWIKASAVFIGNRRLEIELSIGPSQISVASYSCFSLFSILCDPEESTIGRKVSTDIFQVIPKRWYVRMDHSIKPSSQFSVQVFPLPAISSVSKHVVSQASSWLGSRVICTTTYWPAGLTQLKLCISQSSCCLKERGWSSTEDTDSVPSP